MNLKDGHRIRPGPLIALGAALLIAVAVVVCVRLQPDGGSTKEPSAGDSRAEVYLDGKLWDGSAAKAQDANDLRVYIMLDGKELMTLPFAEAHRVRILQPDGGENTVILTGEAVRMEEANCEGQDCVQMGEVTRENLETRVMGGFIICLPHRISVEVRSNE